MERSRRAREAVIAVFCLLAAVQVPAQVETPRFEGGVEVIAVDASVVDGKGQPVRDLTAEDFAVKVDGRTRRVLSARFVEIRTRTLAASPPVAPGAPAPPTSNAAPGRADTNGRRIVLVVDRGQLEGSVHTATQAASRLLDQLGPADRVAVFSLPSGPRLDFVSDRAAIESVLGKIGPIQTGFMSEFNVTFAEALTFLDGRHRNNGVAQRECEQYISAERPHAFEACLERVAGEARRQVEEHERSVEERLNALEALCQALAGMPGPKTLVLISGGFSAANSGGRKDVAEHMRRIATAAAAARISVYSIYFANRHQGYDASVARRPYSADLEEDRRLRTAGLGELTGRAGGALFEVVAGAHFAFDRVASETSAHYLLGLEPATRDRDGKPHEIEVMVLRKGVEVRARRQFVMAAASVAASPRPIPPTAPASPLRVATNVLRGDSEGQIKVLMAAQVDGFSDARLDVKVLDPRGSIVGTLAEQVTGKVAPVWHQETIVLPRGLYTLKAEAVDSGGRQAAIERPLNAELGHGVGFDVSDLLLLESVDGKMRLSATGAIAGATMGVYLELYVQDELPTERVGVSVEVIGRDGARRAVLALPVQRTAAGLLFAEGTADLWALPPGPYVARAQVLFGPRVARRVERAFEFTGRDRPEPPRQP
jgi:VWFA-related protein